MKRTWISWRFLTPFLVLVACACAQTPAPHPVSDLGGTSWQLVEFRPGNGTTLTPKDRTRYVLEFATDGSLDLRIDCNRGRGTWKSAGAGQLELGPLALTRAMCPSDPLNDRLPRDWQSIRSYVIKDGHLFLTPAGGGTYEFEPRGGQGETQGASAISALPATFVGNLPCADCPGIHYQVNLLPDHTFVSRMTYEGRTAHLDDRGRWELAADGKALVLHGRRGGPEKFAVHDSDTLRKLDTAGHEIVSKLNYDLKRSATFTPIEARGESAANATLENTDWKLTLLGDSPVRASPQKEPHFVLDSKTKSVSGSGGCNRLAGSYTLDGDHLSFHQTVSTMMACLEGMDTEKAFLQVLSQVDNWKISGRRLELFDKAGKRIAVFEAGNTN